uniref:Venom S1 protease 3 n=1 Tax=Ectomocoris sp. TaxID=3104572 RepID=A0AB38ZE44_9HEMI
MLTLNWFMMASSLIILMVNADTIHELKTVNPGDDMTLWPNVESKRAITKWSFETCKGCRIILSCVILLRNCEDHVLTIDDGQTTKTYCGDDIDYASRNSHENKLSFTIETGAAKTGSYCRLLVTKPYTNMEYIEKDSSEEGLGKGATKTTSCKCGWTNKQAGRIVNGQEAGVNEYPFAALIMLKRRMFPYCGGSIISPSFILTAAHCTKPFKGLLLAVAVGEHDTRTTDESPFTKLIDVRKTIEHPLYVEPKNRYDIALMKLEEKMEFNDGVGRICLTNNHFKNLNNEYVKAMGWGLLKTNGTESPVLRKVNLKVIDIDICKTVFPSVDKKSDYQVCTWAPNKDSCQGDSGGPLVWHDPELQRYVQVALVSFGRECGSQDPAVNSKVSYFMEWIKKVTAPEEVCT